MIRNKEQYQVKIVLIGSDGVGKTSLRRRYLGLGFKTSHIKTLGSDFSVKPFDLENIYGKAVIWDLAGEAYNIPRTEAYLKGGLGVLAVYDLTKKRSLENIPRWVEWCTNVLKGIPIYLIGNKLDLESDREVSQDDVEQTREQILKTYGDDITDIKLYQTSALTGEGVNSAFEDILKQIGYDLQFKEGH